MDTPEFNAIKKAFRPTKKLMIDGRLRDIRDLVKTETEWAAHYVWYLEHVLVGDHHSLSESDHQRRRLIESTVPPARLAEWAELASDPDEAESLFAWLQGRLDFAEFIDESIEWRLGTQQNEESSRVDGVIA